MGTLAYLLDLGFNKYIFVAPPVEAGYQEVVPAMGSALTRAFVLED